MRITINRQLVPVKAHFLFFFAALGPVLPQLNVYGRQLGVSPEVMGLVTAVLPLLWAAAKPGFGFVVDYFTSLRKQIFILLIIVMSSCFCSLWFLPQPSRPLGPETKMENIYHISDTIYLESVRHNSLFKENIALSPVAKDGNGTTFRKYECYWSHIKKQFDIYLLDIKEIYIDTLYIDNEITNRTCTIYGMDFVRMDVKLQCRTNDDQHLICVYDDEEVNLEKTETSPKIIEINLKAKDSAESAIKTYDSNINIENFDTHDKGNATMLNMTHAMNEDSVILNEKYNVNHTLAEVTGSSNVSIENIDTNDKGNATTSNMTQVINDEIGIVNEKYNVNQTVVELVGSIYGSVTFWGFVVLMCVGMVAFNVANCISDAICFDVLGPDRSSKYGVQRAWGTAGYGVSAFLGGWLVDLWSDGDWKNFTPAFVLAALFTVLDVLSCRKLKLPRLTSAESGGEALRTVLSTPRVMLFIVFAVIAGMLDSFIIYYLFWYVEELAQASGDMANVKLLEGVIVFGQSFVGEIIFFFLSGRILDRFGYGATMTFCLLSYGLRLACVTFVTNPWYLVPVEAVMQGPTYALCYATIVGYAACVAPEGHSATMQGIVAGMDDGVGFALGSLLGGQLYGHAGGRGAFRVMALVAVAAGAVHAVLHYTVLRTERDKRVDGASTSDVPGEGDKMLENHRAVVIHSNGVYCDTVVPLRDKMASSVDR